MNRGTWWAIVHGVTRVGLDLVTKHQQHIHIYVCVCVYIFIFKLTFPSSVHYDDKKLAYFNFPRVLSTY